MDKTGSGSYQVVGFGISGAEVLSSATTLLISKTDLRDIG